MSQAYTILFVTDMAGFSPYISMCFSNIIKYCLFKIILISFMFATPHPIISIQVKVAKMMFYCALAINNLKRVKTIHFWIIASRLPINIMFNISSLQIQSYVVRQCHQQIEIQIIITIILIRFYNIKIIMKISHENTNIFFKQYYFPDQINIRNINAIIGISWILLILVGTIIIGVGTANTQKVLDYCTDSQTFCTGTLIITEATELFFYLKLTNFYQNNRMFTDSFSIKQLHGQIDTKAHCGDYYTYGSLSKTKTVGGYMVASSMHAHPCGEVMKPFQVDNIYLVDNQGGTPQLNNGDLVSSFSLNHFIRQSQYQLSQWVDVQSQQFVNYFTIPYTSTKYLLIGKTSVSAGSYQIVMQNNFFTQNIFNKQLIVTEVGQLGMTNHFLGFSLFVFGLLVLLFHIYLCLKSTK